MKNKMIQLLVVAYFVILGRPRISYPIFAQQNYASPREANGRIVCANCHLAQKPVELKIPQAVLPNTVFERLVSIPYDLSVKQVGRNGKRRELNVGAVLMLPQGFQIANQDRASKSSTKRVYFQPYSAERKNIIVVGPVPGKTNQILTFPVITPTKETSFLKFSVYLGGNRGRGQVYPDGSKSNNNAFTFSSRGKVREIEKKSGKGGFQIFLETADGKVVKEEIPPGPELIVKVGDIVSADQAITNNPNVGGFGQAEGEIVLQDPRRIQRLLIFFLAVLLAQVSLVLKKKQFEKIQLATINFSCSPFFPTWDF